MAEVPARIHLPRSLVALFPGAPRVVELPGATVLDLIAALDREVPGMRDRLLDAGPSIRDHINVFVAGELAGLDTAVPAGAEVHIIPAVSGGADEIDPREAERIRRRDREMTAEQRALLQPGMGKVFKQIQDAQAQAAGDVADAGDLAEAGPARKRKRRGQRPSR